MKTIKKIHKAQYKPIGDLITYSPLPSAILQQIDPFIFLNHHGPQNYNPNNNGLPFGPHPHRGMETVTFIIDGDIAHKDSTGSESVINAGGIQWMTAGSGLIHSEISSEKFKKEGGNMEILQLWLNLPAKYKMTAPKYVGLQKNEIPHIIIESGITINLIAGEWEDKKGPFETLTDIFLSTIELKSDGLIHLNVNKSNNVFFYLIKGSLNVNGVEISKLNLVEFNNDDNIIKINANEESLLLFGHAKPFNEPIVAQGPFVMNTHKEIQKAYDDFHNGKMGIWN